MGVNKTIYTAQRLGKPRQHSPTSVASLFGFGKATARRGGKVFITGDKELDKKLREIEPKVSRKISRSAMRKGAKIILADAQQLVPEDTGKLRSSMKVKALPRSRARFGVTIGTKDGMFESGKFYGQVIEFGGKYWTADPYLRPAGYGNEAQVRKLVIDDIRTELAKL